MRPKAAGSFTVSDLTALTGTTSFRQREATLSRYDFDSGDGGLPCTDIGTEYATGDAACRAAMSVLPTIVMDRPRLADRHMRALVARNAARHRVLAATLDPTGLALIDR